MENDPHIEISNFNFQIDPFLILSGNTRKTYYLVNINFLFLTEVERKFFLQETDNDSPEEIHQKKEFERKHDLFVETINKHIQEATKFKKYKMKFNMEILLFPDKKYTARVVISYFKSENIFRMEHKKESMVDKYLNKLQYLVQTAGDQGITLTNIIRKTQSLPKDARLAMLNDLTCQDIIILEKIKTSAKDINIYHWNNDKKI